MVDVLTTKAGRFYKKGKIKFKPSITTALKVVNMESLNIWRGRVGNVEADRKTQEGGDLGDVVHKMIETYLVKDLVKDIIPFSLNPVAIKLFFQARAWLTANVQRVVVTEERLLGARYGGTLDLRCILKKDDAHAIIDWKTSKQMDNKWGWQLSAQTSLYEETNAGRAPIDKLLIVRLKKKEKELENPKTKVQVKEYKYDMTAFNACLALWNEMYEVPKEKQ